MPEVTRNHLKLTNEGGTNKVILNGRDIAPEISSNGFSLTFDPQDLNPVLQVWFPIDEIDADLAEVAVSCNCIGCNLIPKHEHGDEGCTCGVRP